MRRIFNFKSSMSIVANNLEHAKSYLKEVNPNISEEDLMTGVECDYDSVYVYFPVNEIMEEDKPYIYDHKRVGSVDEIASISLKMASKYQSFIDKENKEKFPNIYFWEV